MRIPYLHYLFLCITIALLPQGHAQYGAVDLSFNPVDDGSSGDGPLFNHTTASEPGMGVTCALELPDGGLLLAGYWNTYHRNSTPRLIRTFPDGTWDPSFSWEYPEDHRPMKPTLLPDGGLLVVFSVPGPFPSTGNAVLRYGPDGTLDPTFSVNTSSFISDILPLADGTTLIAGAFTQVNGGPAVRVAKLLNDGSLDPNFNMGVGPNNIVRALVALPDGSVVIGGGFTMVGSQAIRGVARLLANGALDPTFDPMAVVTSEYISVNDLALDGDGRLIIGGGFTLSGEPEQRNLMRILPDGSHDTTFPIGSGTSSSVNVLTLRPDGSMLVGGLFSSIADQPRTGLAALAPDGTLDPTFIADIRHPDGVEISGLTRTADGDLLVWGRMLSVDGRYHLALARLQPNGTVEPSFNPGKGAGGIVKGMAVMADGRIAIGGDMVSYNDTPRPYLAFLTPDGALDPVFNGGAGPNAQVQLLIPMPGDRLFIAGEFTSYDGVPVPRMAVVDAFGALVPGIDFPVEALPSEDDPSAAVALEDGSILFATVPEYQSADWTGQLYRFLPDGTLDSGFQPPQSLFGGVNTMLVQPDGRILLGGTLRVPSGAKGIARLLPNGARDQDFLVGSGVGPLQSSRVYTMALMPDGRIIIAGAFTSYQGIPATRITCLNPDGTPCTDFATTGPTNSMAGGVVIVSIAPLPDGRLVLAGNFGSYDGGSSTSMAIALPDGTVDPTFSIGTGPDYPAFPWLHQVLVDAEGNYLIRGYFHTINGVPRHRIARILGGGGVGMNDAAITDRSPLLWPNPVADRLQTTEPLTGTIFDTQGRAVLTVYQKRTIEVAALTSGPYLLRTTDGGTARFMKE